MGTATLSNSGDVPINEEPSIEPAAGMRLGRYELVKRIASGGMAQVWSAQQTGEFGFRRACAVKVIRPEYATSASFRRMFLDEARLASRIHHPHVVEVFDLGEAGPIVYQAMELVKGCTLAKLLIRAAGGESSGSRPGLDTGIVCRIIADMATGLHAAHELTDEAGHALKLVHRDVSPQNILVSVDGMAKIADFGIAKAFGRLTDETEAGQLKGKLSYLSPEMAERRGVDRRSDVFASGIVMWEALTGRRLFRGEDAVDTLARVRETVVPDPREIAPDVPAPVVEVVLRALERDPDRRYPTAAELSDAIEEAALASKRRIGAKQLAARVSEVLGVEVTSQISASGPARTSLPGDSLDAADVAVPTTFDRSLHPSRRRVSVAAAAIIGGALVASAAFAMTRRTTGDHGGAAQVAPEPVEVPATNATAMAVIDPGSVARVVSASSVAPPVMSAPATSARPIASTRPAVSKPTRNVGRPGTKNETDPKLPFGNPY